MKKTLLAALVAASFGVSAYAGVTLPVANSAGNPISIVLSGKVDLQGLGQYSYAGNDDQSYSESSLGYNVNGLKLALDASTAFMNSFTAFSHVDVGSADVLKDQDKTATVFAIKKFYVGVSNDAYGTFTIGKQGSASGDLSYNAFGDYDILNYGSQTAGSALSIKYQSPEFQGVTVAASLALTNTGDKTTAKDKSDVTNSTTPVTFSLGAQYEMGDLTVAATADLQKEFKSANGSEVHQHGSFATTLGGGYTYNNITAFANIGYATNGFVDLGLDGRFSKPLPKELTLLPETPEGAHLMQFGGQIGASADLTSADTVTAAFQAGSVWTSGKDNKGHVMMLGFEAAASHSFNANFSASLFVTYNHLGLKGFKGEDGKDATGLPHANLVNYGLDVTYKF